MLEKRKGKRYTYHFVCVLVKTRFWLNQFNLVSDAKFSLIGSIYPKLIVNNENLGPNETENNNIIDQIMLNPFCCLNSLYNKE